MFDCRSTECMAITSHHDGTYTVTWVPTSSGSYDVYICIDSTTTAGNLTTPTFTWIMLVFIGDHQSFVVLPLEEEGLSLVEEEQQEQEDKEQEKEEETVVTEIVKKKIFPSGKAAGLRIRSQPSFASTAIGLIKPGNTFSYVEEVCITYCLRINF